MTFGTLSGYDIWNTFRIRCLEHFAKIKIVNFFLANPNGMTDNVYYGL